MPFNDNDLNAVFTRSLGRAPNAQELAFFNSLGKNDDISPFEIEQVLQGMPEAQQARLQSQGKQYGEMLDASNGQVLNQAADVAQSRLAQQGRSGSSAFGSQVLSAGRDLASQKQSALASFYNQGYQQQRGQYQENSQSSLGRAYGLGDSRTQYNRDLSMYNMQRNDYNDYLNSANRQGKRKAWAGLAGSLAGAGVGSFLSPVGGGAAGAKLGSGIGGQVGGLF